MQARGFLLYRKYRAVLKCESYVSYRVKSPSGQDAHLAEKKLMLCIPLGRVSVHRRTLFIKQTVYTGTYFLRVAATAPTPEDSSEKYCFTSSAMPFAVRSTPNIFWLERSGSRPLKSFGSAESAYPFT